MFSAVHQYLDPPMNVAHEGGIFVSCSMKKSSQDAKRLLELNKKVIKDFGLRSGVTHTEFIKSQTDGEFYFLETAARVGGANIAELIEAATGINLWKEWAKLETAHKEKPYLLPERRNEYSGIVLTLCKQKAPDTTAYNDPEIYWRLKKKHHVGLVVNSKKWDRVYVLIQNYSKRFQKDFHASLPPLKKASY